MKPQRRLKGKLVSEKQYLHHLKRVANGRKRRKYPAAGGSDGEMDPAASDNPDVTGPEPKQPKAVETLPEEEYSEYTKGRRLVELAVLAKHLWCCSCKELLSLENVEAETRRGLGSILSVRCHKCLIINLVPTGKQHEDARGRISRFDVNSKIVMALINAGMGWTDLRNICGLMNMPAMEFSTFKRYQQEMGRHVEEVARESCMEAAEEEREMTIKNKENIEKIL